MTLIRLSVVTVTASLAAKISLCAGIVYNHRLGRRKWRYNCSIKPAPGIWRFCLADRLVCPVSSTLSRVFYGPAQA